MLHGNEVAAADLYGNGVRIGLYLQVFGMLLSCVRMRTTGLKLPCAASMLGNLASWTLLARRHDFSPAEAWLVLSIVSLLFLPANSALANPDSIVGEATASIALCVALFWNVVANIWFWSSLCYSLPRLGTYHSAWFFSRVHLQHWFRKFQLAGAAFMVIGLVVLLVVYFLPFSLAGAKAWWRGDDKPDIDVDEDRLKAVSIGIAGLGLLSWIIGIVAAEKLILYNELAPAKDLTAPGQAIPLAIGIIVVVDGVFGLFAGIGEEKGGVARVPSMLDASDDRHSPV